MIVLNKLAHKKAQAEAEAVALGLLEANKKSQADEAAAKKKADEAAAKKKLQQENKAIAERILKQEEEAKKQAQIEEEKKIKEKAEKAAIELAEAVYNFSDVSKPKIVKPNKVSMPMNLINNKKIRVVNTQPKKQTTMRSRSFSSNTNTKMAMFIPTSGPGCGSCGRH